MSYGDEPARAPDARRPMPEGEILRGVAEVARRHVGWEGVLRREMRLVEDLRLDSLRLLTLAMEVENHFRIRLTEEDEARIHTVEDLVATIDRKLACKPR
jgi:acyl carrier protein